MAGNLNTSVTVDATQLRSGLALAQQDIKTYGAAVRAAAADIRTSGTATAEQVVALDKASAAYNKAKSEAAGYQDKLGNVSGAHREVAGSAGVAREALVMLHETMMGNYKRLAGSTMVMAERTNALHAVMTALTPAMMGAVGAAAALAAGFAYLTVQAAHTETALRGVYNAALLQGRGAVQAEADTRRFADTMVLTGTVGRKAATEISASIQSIPGVAEDVRAKLSSIAPALFEVWGQDAEKTSKNIDQAFRSISSLGAFLNENRLLTSEQERAFKQAESTKDAFAAQRIGIDALTARLAPAYEGYKKLVDQQKIATASAQLGAVDITGSMVPQMQATPLRMPDAGSKAEDEGTIRQTAATERYLGVLRERQQLEADEAQIRQRMAQTSDAAEITELQTALKVNAARQAGLKNQGDASWAAKVATDAKEAGDAAVIAAHNAGQSRLQIMEAGTKAEMAVYRAASVDMTRTDAERLNAKRQAITLEMSLIEKQAGADKTGARQALQTRIAELSAEQAANHDNYTAVMQLENQKLAILKSAGSAYTKQYQEELKRREDMERQHSALLQRLDLEHITKSEEIDRQALAERRATLDAEVSDHLITKQVELADLQAFAAQQYKIEHAALQDFINNNSMQVAERQKALDQMAALEARHVKTVAALNAQMASADRQTLNGRTQQYDQMFAMIGWSSERATSGLIMGTETWQRAELGVTQSVLQGVVSMGARVVQQWAATELAKTVITDGAVAQRVAAEQANGATGFGAILAHWFGLEASKTTATTVAVGERTATAAAGDVAQTASAVSSQAAQTVAVAAGAQAQAAATIAGKSEAAAASAAINGPAIMSDAAKAAAGAYSAVAGIPYVGPVLAPVAAGVAFAAVAGYESMASLAVGTSYVPNDMMANIHQGEMVVPRFESDMIRSGDASLGGGLDGGGTGGDTHYHIHGPLVSAIDTQTGASFLMANMRTIAQGVAHQQSRNPSMRPNF